MEYCPCKLSPTQNHVKLLDLQHNGEEKGKKKTTASPMVYWGNVMKREVIGRADLRIVKGTVPLEHKRVIGGGCDV